MDERSAAIRVLHVDDDPEFVDVAAEFVEREVDRITVETATDADEGLDRLADGDVDCVVSDHEMPGTDGIEFLRSVRGEYGDLPFVLFTGKGSEGVASEAISAGVTDYLEKESGTDQYAVLANRIENAVDSHRARTNYREVFEKVPDGITLHDPEDGSLLDANQQFCEMLGYTHEKLLEAGFDAIHADDPPHTAERARELVRKAATEGSRTFEWVDETSDGEALPVEVHLRRTVIEGKRRVLAVVRDVSDRKERERELREERDRVRALFENTADAIAYCEFEDGDPVVRDANPAFEETFGCDAATVVDEPIDDVVVPDDRREEAAEINRRVEQGERLENEVRRRATDGLRNFVLRSVPLDPGESGEKSYAIYSDVTERKRHERTLQDLHRSIDRLLEAETRTEACEVVVDIGQSVLEQPYSGVFLWDEDEEVLRSAAASDAALAAFGPPPTYRPGEGIVGHAFQQGDRIVLDDAPDDSRALDQNGDESGPRGYCVLPLGDHGALVFGSPEVGAFDRTDVELADILAAHTEVALDRIAREAALRERGRELERQNERLDDFVSVVSHDLRNPLNIARGRVDAAREECDSDHLDHAVQAHDRMETLIEDLLVLARTGEPAADREPVDVAAVVDECWPPVETSGATIEVDVDRVVLAERSRLRRLFENLLRNAIEHGGPGVTVWVGELDGTPGEDANGRSQEGDARGGFYVEDDGPGIPAAEHDQVFDFGYSTSEAGTGLGLAIVDRIVDVFDWDVRVTEGTGDGARFEFTGVEFADG